MKHRHRRTTWPWWPTMIVALALAAWFYRDKLEQIIVLPSRDTLHTIVVSCERVIDGDSLIVNRNGERVEVRLEGIDCPEFDQPYRNEAKSLTAALCQGSQLRLLVIGRDKYGRQLARVFVDKQEVNSELVAAGLAWQYGGDGRLRWLENKARAKKIGIWSEPDPVPPWQWRADRP